MRRIIMIVFVLAALVVATVVGAIMIRTHGEQHPAPASSSAAIPARSDMAVPEPPSLPDAGSERRSSMSALGVSPDVGVVTKAEMNAVWDLRNTPGALDAMKVLATEGNEYAMSELGDTLLGCSPRGLELHRYRMAKEQRHVDRLKSRLTGGDGSPPAPAASVDRLTMRIVSNENMTAMEAELFDNACKNLVVHDASRGFDWLSRAADRGYKQARMSYIEKTVRFFGSPHLVARYPEQAIASRDQARVYLEQIRAECTRDALSIYAWWSVALYKFDVEQRYTIVATWLGTNHGSTIVDAGGSWGSNQEEALQRLTTPEQRQRAEQRAQAWLDRCGNS